MSASEKEAGTIQVLLKRLNHERLPRALELKKRVDAGARLEDHDLKFLKQVLEDAGLAQRVIAKHPEYESLVTRMISLYAEITRKALENEQKS